MDINLNYDTLYGKVERSLSIIGKRSKDDDGNLLFKDITLGSREKEIINDYFRQAVIDLTTELETFVTAGSTSGVTFALDMPTNHNSALNPFVVQSCEEYCVSYALYSWFVITAPHISEKYLGDCRRQLSAVIRMTGAKTAPAETGDILSTSTSVSS